jgi:hypothetical protein
MTMENETAVRACLGWADDLDALPDFGPVFDNRSLAAFWRYVAGVVQDGGPLDDVSAEALRQARPIAVAMAGSGVPAHITGAAALLAALDARLEPEEGLGL